MPIKHTIKVEVENDLEEALGDIMNDKKNNFEIEGVIIIYHGINPKDRYPIAKLYLKDKHAEFHEGFTKSNLLNNNFRRLINYFNEKEWTNNLD